MSDSFTSWKWMLGLYIVVIALIYALHPMLPKVTMPNYRAELVGSRFSAPRM